MNPRRINWDIFDNLVRDEANLNNFKPIANLYVLKQTVVWMNRALSTAYTKLVQYQEHRGNKNPPWWNKEIAGSVKGREGEKFKKSELSHEKREV